MNESFTPGKLIERLEGKTELDKILLKRLHDELFATISRELRREGHFVLSSFGSFKRILVPASQGRNPQTGEAIDIPEHYRIRFAPVSKVARRINAEFAHLKAQILEDEVAPAATVQHTAPLREETQRNPTEEIKVAETLITNEAEQDDKPKRGLRKILLLLLILLIALGIWLLLPKGSKEPASSIETTKAADTIPAPVQKKEAGVSTKYIIKSDDTFSSIAIQEWGMIELWPYLYSKNMDSYLHPDHLKQGEVIMVPPKPDLLSMQKDIENSILKTYDRYQKLIKEESDSEEYSVWQKHAKEIIANGEALYPGFLREYRERIKAEDLKAIKSAQ